MTTGFPSDDRRRIGTNRIKSEEIYRQDWRGLAEEIDYISQTYLATVTFFKNAADANDAMLVYLN